jgi:hypothetical protein
MFASTAKVSPRDLRLVIVAGSFAGGNMVVVVWSSDGNVEQIDEVHLGTEERSALGHKT